VVPQRNSLTQLPQFRLPEHLFQLGLPHQHDLDQLRLGGLEIRQQPDLLEHLGREVLRFVDDEQRLLVLLQPPDQERVQGQKIFSLGSSLSFDLELVEEHSKEVEGIEARIEDEGGARLRIELAEKRVDQGRLAVPDLARQHHEALA